MKEEWKDIIESGSICQISNLGRIRKKSYIDKAGKIRRSKILSPFLSVYRRNYMFRFKRKGKKYLVKKIVAEYFVNNPNNYPYVEFKDGDFGNLRADNLYWTDKIIKKKGLMKNEEKDVYMQ